MFFFTTIKNFLKSYRLNKKYIRHLFSLFPLHMIYGFSTSTVIKVSGFFFPSYNLKKEKKERKDIGEREGSRGELGKEKKEGREGGK